MGIVFMEVERFDCIDKLIPQIEICAFLCSQHYTSGSKNSD